MEREPDTTNVVYMDEARKARWLRQLDDARDIGGVATFNFEYSDPAKIIPFPRTEEQPEPPDGAA